MRTAQENIAASPHHCYSVTNVDDKDALVMIKAGESGFHIVTIRVDGTPQENADYLNEILGVTKKEHDAMVTGSMSGWDCPGADPDNS